MKCLSNRNHISVDPAKNSPKKLYKSLAIREIYARFDTALSFYATRSLDWPNKFAKVLYKLTPILKMAAEYYRDCPFNGCNPQFNNE